MTKCQPQNDDIFIYKVGLKFSVLEDNMPNGENLLAVEGEGAQATSREYIFTISLSM